MHITQNPIYKHGTKAVEINKITWREIPSDDRNIFFDWVLEETIRKNQVGHETYGDTFAGDPLIHLAEELLDGLFYVYAAFRQRQALEVAAQEATNDLQRLRNSQAKEEARIQVTANPRVALEQLNQAIKEGYRLYCHYVNSSAPTKPK